nr:zinc finger BED domain-containing protein RICESLEEPER 3-like isoform X2 [Ipomoea batatas]
MRPIKKKFRLQSGRTPHAERSTASRSSPPSNHSISTSSRDSDSLVKGKGTRAKARANDDSVTGGGGTTTTSGAEKSKPKAKQQRSEMYPVDQLKDQASILSDKVRNAMVELFEEYRKMHQPQSSQSTQRESIGHSNSSSLTDDIIQKKGKEKKNKSDFKKYKVEIGCGEQYDWQCATWTVNTKQ